MPISCPSRPSRRCCSRQEETQKKNADDTELRKLLSRLRDQLSITGGTLSKTDLADEFAMAAASLRQSVVEFGDVLPIPFRHKPFRS